MSLTVLFPLLSLDTSAALHSHEMLWPGEYKLQVEVTDAKGLSCAASEPFTVEVCDCVEKEGCGARTARLGTPSSELSASAIGLLLMALCLLLRELSFNKLCSTHYYHIIHIITTTMFLTD